MHGRGGPGYQRPEPRDGRPRHAPVRRPAPLFACAERLVKEAGAPPRRGAPRVCIPASPSATIPASSDERVASHWRG